MLARWRVAAVGLLAAAASAGTLAQPAELIAWRVQPKDTLIGIARSALVDPQAWREVASVNRLANPNRIRPGQVLMIPERLLRKQALPVRVINAIGDVRAGPQGPALDAGQTIDEGQSLVTGPDGSAVVELADGTRIKVQPSSVAEVLASRRYATPPPDPAAQEGGFAAALRVLQGSIEIFATKVLRARPLEVTTPTAVVGVRGTTFRVGLLQPAGEDAALQPVASRAEVLEGRIHAQAGTTPRAGAAVPVDEGFGVAIDATTTTPKVAALLPAPDLSSVPTRFERPIIRFTLADTTTKHRVQVAEDAAFERMVADRTEAAGAEVRVAGLQDGTWHLRARRIDASGIEGFDAQRAVVLKARPEPPGLSLPPPGSKLSAGPVRFAWAPNIGAATYRLQIAGEAGFEAPIVERSGLMGNRVDIEGLAPGRYRWRMGSTRTDGDEGPWGDPQEFEVRPLPEPPKGGLSKDGKTLSISWSGRAGDIQQVELARDRYFSQIVASADLQSPHWEVAKPEIPDVYYFRYRSIEPDGFVSPWSETLQLDLSREWSDFWKLLPVLLPLLLVL
jgi:hypothetical protein